MACSDCNSGSSTVITAGDGISIDGIGTAGDPYVISEDDNPEGDWSVAFDATSNPDVNLSALLLPATVRVAMTQNGALILPSGWSSSRAGSFTLVLTQDGTGGRTLDFSSVASEAPIVLSTAAGAKDVVVVHWTGLQWIATAVLLDVE